MLRHLPKIDYLEDKERVNKEVTCSKNNCPDVNVPWNSCTILIIKHVFSFTTAQ